MQGQWKSIAGQCKSRVGQWKSMEVGQCKSMEDGQCKSMEVGQCKSKEVGQWDRMEVGQCKSPEVGGWTSIVGIADYFLGISSGPAGGLADNYNLGGSCKQPTAEGTLYFISLCYVSFTFCTLCTCLSLKYIVSQVF